MRHSAMLGGVTVLACVLGYAVPAFASHNLTPDQQFAAGHAPFSVTCKMSATIASAPLGTHASIKLLVTNLTSTDLSGGLITARYHFHNGELHETYERVPSFTPHAAHIVVKVGQYTQSIDATKGCQAYFCGWGHGGCNSLPDAHIDN